MAIIELTVCDVCRKTERKVTRFDVSEDGVVSALELCKEDAAPLRALLRYATVVAPKGASPIRPVTPASATVPRKPLARRRRGFGETVTTMDQIEASKRV